MTKSGEALRQLERLRALCAIYPETSERLSHGEPTFFARNRVFVMFDDHHHGADRIAAWLPAPDGMQELLIGSNPDTYFRPPYVGVKGWVGVVLDRTTDQDLAAHVHQAWLHVAPRTLQKSFTARG
ncbi:MmcQ/YjbR family DNA-binding protein [bacterium]|nr:MmcQ/YjbR family DNA-binding protein [bacterium]